jgi:hypothetical protein
MAVVPYHQQQPAGYAVVPYQAPGAIAVASPQKKPQPATPWLYSTEIDPNASAPVKTDVPPVRKSMYGGTLWRPLLDEAYFCAHLSSQTEKSSAVVPGEVLQFQSSTNKTNVLTVVNASLETPNSAWRILGDGRTNYLIFRGAAEWMYPLFDTKLAVLHDVSPKTNIKVHNAFLHDLIPHMTTIIASLKHSPARRIVITGHGNGGALATICFLLLQRAGFSRHQLIVYTFGAPLVTCGNSEIQRPLPNQFTRAIFNFVNEDDFIPCILGNKDLSTVDAMVSSVQRRENPLKNGMHSVLDLKSYQTMGKYYHLTQDFRMVDVVPGKETSFLHVSRSRMPLSERLRQHSVEQYLSKIRHIVQDN